MASEQEMLDYLKIADKMEAYCANITCNKDYPNQYTINKQISIYFNESTFANCQNFTIGAFSDILTLLPETEWQYIISHFRTLSGGKELLVIDVKQVYTPTIKRYFTNIVAETPYTSNNSKMVMFIINVSKF